jgi:hypothetical protein
MKKLVFAIVLVVASPAYAQTNLAPKKTTARVDNCIPIGRTAKGELIYSLKCDHVPVPPAPPQAEVVPPPEPEAPPEPAVQRSGLFGMSYAPPGTPPPSAPAGQ